MTTAAQLRKEAEREYPPESGQDGIAWRQDGIAWREPRGTANRVTVGGKFDPSSGINSPNGGTVSIPSVGDTGNSKSAMKVNNGGKSGARNHHRLSMDMAAMLTDKKHQVTFDNKAIDSMALGKYLQIVVEASNLPVVCNLVRKESPSCTQLEANTKTVLFNPDRLMGSPPMVLQLLDDMKVQAGPAVVFNPSLKDFQDGEVCRQTLDGRECGFIREIGTRVRLQVTVTYDRIQEASAVQRYMCRIKVKFSIVDRAAASKFETSCESKSFGSAAENTSRTQGTNSDDDKRSVNELPAPTRATRGKDQNARRTSSDVIRNSVKAGVGPPRPVSFYGQSSSTGVSTSERRKSTAAEAPGSAAVSGSVSKGSVEAALNALPAPKKKFRRSMSGTHNPDDLWKFLQDTKELQVPGFRPMPQSKDSGIGTGRKHTGISPIAPRLKNGQFAPAKEHSLKDFDPKTALSGVYSVSSMDELKGAFAKFKFGYNNVRGILDKTRHGTLYFNGDVFMLALDEGSTVMINAKDAPRLQLTSESLKASPNCMV